MQTGAIVTRDCSWAFSPRSADARTCSDMTGNWLAELAVPSCRSPMVRRASSTATTKTGSPIYGLGDGLRPRGPDGPGQRGLHRHERSFVFALPKTTLVQISTMFSFSGSAGDRHAAQQPAS